MIVKRLSALLVPVILLSMVSGCSTAKKENKPVDTKDVKVSNLNPTGFPIVNQPITLKIMISKNDAMGEADKLLVFQEYEKKTGVKIEWQNVNSGSIKDTVKLALASQDLPDAFMKAGINNPDQLSFGSQGMFINLNDGLIDKYGPNIKKFLEAHKDVKKSQTFENGAIYSLPAGVETPAVRVARKLFINAQWLKKVGKEMPKTTDELYDVLTAFKEKDPNGNGKADEIPFTSDALKNIIDVTKGAFGIGNRGIIQTDLDMDESTGKIRYIPTSTGYKDFIDYLRKLYSESIIDKEIFSMKSAQFSAKSIEGVVGACVGPNTANFGANHVAEFEGIPTALKGPKGDQVWSPLRPNTVGTGAFLITSANKYPEATMRWVDYFYGDEGTLFYHYGIEGKSYKKTADGKYDWSDEIYKSVTPNTTFDNVVGKYSAYVGGSNPAIIKEPYYGGREMEPVSYKAAMDMMSFVPKEAWPEFTYSLKENERLVVLQTDINGYVSKMQAEFISGKTPLSQWDTYVEQIKKMGLDEMMKIHEAAYERYKK
ncbi:MAG: transporter substrate-binding protein [Clostridiales bacterium]|nr:transporter substrate-binding protein [Clostridiales bacterium]